MPLVVSPIEKKRVQVRGKGGKGGDRAHLYMYPTASSTVKVIYK